MKHVKRNIIFIVGLITLALSTSVVFGAFIFTRIIKGDAQTGNFYEIEKNIINYAYYADKTEQEMAELAANPASLQTLLSNLHKRKATGVKISSDSIVCYATKRTGKADNPNEYHFPDLNQLGFTFSFTTTIDAYIKIHFEDAWISKKDYVSGKEEQTYIIKDQLNGIYEQIPDNQVNQSNYAAYYVINPTQTYATSRFSTTQTYFTKSNETGFDVYTYAPLDEEEFDNTKATTTYYTLNPKKTKGYSATEHYFKFSADSPFKITDENWYYDAGTNVAYYKTKIDVDEQEAKKQTFDDFKFDIDEKYFYKEKYGSYTESVKIQLSYYVDVVQANRVYEIWGVEPEKLI